MRKENINKIIFIVLVLLVIILAIALINSYGFQDLYNKKGNYKWVGSLGTYVSFAATLLVLFISTKQTRKIQNENLTLTNKIQEDNRRNAIRPLIDLEFPTSLILNYKECFDNQSMLDVSSIELENGVKLGPYNRNIFKIVNLSNDNAAKDITIGWKIDTGVFVTRMKKLHPDFSYVTNKTNLGTEEIEYSIDKEGIKKYKLQSSNILMPNSFRYIKGDSSEPIELMQSLAIVLIDPIRHLLYSYQKCVEKDDNKENFEKHPRKLLFMINITIKYKDIEYNRRSKKYDLSFTGKSVDFYNKNIYLDIKVEKEETIEEEDNLKNKGSY